MMMARTAFLARHSICRPQKTSLVFASSQNSRFFASKTRNNFPPSPRPNEDPHAMAARFVKQSSSDDRMSGVEALEDVPMEVKMRNYATAAILLGFVAGVFWYSMNAVGRSDQGAFEAEALEAREKALLKERAREQGDEKDIMKVEMGISADGDNTEDVVIAVAAPDLVASLEEDKNRDVMKDNDSSASKRPLWKRIVFFWRVA